LLASGFTDVLMIAGFIQKTGDVAVLGCRKVCGHYAPVLIK